MAEEISLARTLPHPPPLVGLPFIDEDPKEIWEKCFQKQKSWNELLSEKKAKRYMDTFRQEKALNFVWHSNKLEGTLPPGISQGDTHAILKNMYSKTNDIELPKNDGERQLVQHLLAYKNLCESGVSNGSPLSEELIRDTHKTLMDRLLTEENQPIQAGAYRCISMRAGKYTFPDHSTIPEAMKSIVAEYNRKAASSHDTYELASWLLFKVASLHPFEDGNGRLCQLLSCYSLMRDGLPFPLTISSGRSKAPKHFLWCIKKGQQQQTDPPPQLTTLIVASVYRSWSNFYLNLEFV